jgi:hypothetical protein
MQVIDRAALHRRRIFALAQRRRDAWHYTRGDASDLASSRTMYVAAEHGDDPSAALQGIAQPRHAVHCLEMKAVRSDRHLKGRMVREYGNRFVGLGIDQFDQMLRLFTAKIAAAVART